MSSEEQRDRFVAKCLGLLDINAPGDIVRCTNIPVDVRLLAHAALGSLRGSERHQLHLWIEEEARHGSSWLCKSIPPFSILKCPDLLDKLWGWDRLLAYDIDWGLLDADRAIYESYLEKFYASNHHNDAPDAIFKCLEKERVLSSDWKAKRAKVNVALSGHIKKCMSNLVNDAGSESRQPFSTYAAVCTTKEAELMIEWLRQGSPVPLEEYNTCNKIRGWALELAKFQGKWNTHIAAVLLGITKEAVFLRERASRGDLVLADISTRIRTYGLDNLIYKFDELLNESESDAEFTPRVSDEMTSATGTNQPAWGNTKVLALGRTRCKNNSSQRESLTRRTLPRRSTQ